MTFHTEQIFTNRVFYVVVNPSTDPADLARSITLAKDALVTLVRDWLAVVRADHRAQTGRNIDLQHSLPMSEILDRKIRIACDVDMAVWPEGVMFDPSVLAYLSNSGVEVID